MNQNFAVTRAVPRAMSHTLAALFLAAGLAAGANAAPGDPATGAPTAQQQMGGHMHRHHMGGQHGERGLRAMARLHDELKLDAQQEALWKDAASASREAHSAMRERFRKQHGEMVAALGQPGADLRALAKKSDELRAEREQQHAATRDRWLTVYDALNPEQKEKARAFLKQMFERRAAHSPQARRPA